MHVLNASVINAAAVVMSRASATADWTTLRYCWLRVSSATSSGSRLTISCAAWGRAYL